MGKERAAVVYGYGNNDLFNNIKLRCVCDDNTYIGKTCRSQRVRKRVYIIFKECNESNVVLISVKNQLMANGEIEMTK